MSELTKEEAEMVLELFNSANIPFKLGEAVVVLKKKLEAIASSEADK
jgi:predicted transcriptional regulator